MAKVITVMNMKGGVGKTTITANLGGLLGLSKINGKNRRVLLIDYDPQFNLSQTLIPPKIYFSHAEEKKTILSVLMPSDTLLDPFNLKIPDIEATPSVDSLVVNIIPTLKNGCLHVIPSTLDLMYLALGETDTATSTSIDRRFENFILDCRSKYDLIFIDCHPAGSIFTRTALRNSDHVLIPVGPSKFASRGVGLMKQFIDSAHANKSAPEAHILFNYAPKIGVYKEEEEIRANPRLTKLCLVKNLKKYSAFSELNEGRGFVWHNKKAHSTAAFTNLYFVATELAERIGA